jgi:DNA processing protein
MIVVSGLAYGIDIAAHKAALSEGISTVGVLAHGLDRIYPYEHRNVAAQMIHSGGLLTDFISGTQPDRQNFVKRNRIVAGISDCTIVIESAAKGGAMITANIANSYNRDVFAVPGNVHSPYSSGCNQLIKSRKAALVENMEDIVAEMCWTLGSPKNQAKIIQKQFVPDISPEGQSIVDILSISGNMHINILSIELNMPVSKLSSTLFELEMSGIVRSFPGGMYNLCKN